MNIDEYIFTCYEIYKEIMKCPNLPSIVPTQIKSPGKAIAYVMSDEIYGKTVPLYYSFELEKCLEQFIRAKLFHEFTHIFDGNVGYNIYLKANYIAYLSLYSEYHASQIELLENLGILKVSREMMIFNSEYAKIAHKYGYLPLTADVYSPLVAAQAIVSDQNNYCDLSFVEYYDIYHNFESRIMYYLGKIGICQKYGYPTISDSIQEYCPDYAPCIYEIWGAIENKEFDKLNDLRNQLWNRFKEHFDCKATLPDNL